MKSKAVIIIALIFFIAPIILSQNLPNPISARHHDGFFLRYVAGGGTGNYQSEPVGSATDYFNKFKFSGGLPISSALQIGGTVSENVIVFGEVCSNLLLSPDGEIWRENADVTVNQVLFGGVGPGITYYFMPVNIYVSGSLLYTVGVHDYEATYSSIFLQEEVMERRGALGFATHFIVGKEWWVGEEVGIGASAYAYLGWLSDPDFKDRSITSNSFGVMFSLTYN